MKVFYLSMQHVILTGHRQTIILTVATYNGLNRNQKWQKGPKRWLY